MIDDTFTPDELLRIERSAWHYARKFIEEARMVHPGPGYEGFKDYYLSRVRWHRDHAKQMRAMRLELCKSTSNVVG